MKNINLITLCLFLGTMLSAQKDAVGIWQAVDDNDGKVSSLIEIKEVDGKLSGVIKEIYKESPSSLCEKCEGDKKNQPVLGMEIIWDMKKKGDSWKGGRILDPENGKTYKCKMSISKDDEDVLEVRGFIGLAVIGRSQYWKRLN